MDTWLGFCANIRSRGTVIIKIHADDKLMESLGSIILVHL